MHLALGVIFGLLHATIADFADLEGPVGTGLMKFDKQSRSSRTTQDVRQMAVSDEASGAEQSLRARSNLLQEGGDALPPRVPVGGQPLPFAHVLTQPAPPLLDRVEPGGGRRQPDDRQPDDCQPDDRQPDDRQPRQGSQGRRPIVPIVPILHIVPIVPIVMGMDGPGVLDTRDADRDALGPRLHALQLPRAGADLLAGADLRAAKQRGVPHVHSPTQRVAGATEAPLRRR
jgi:hypothetical protein